jgi:hypothetical protein
VGGGKQNRLRLYSASLKTQDFHFLLSLHHPNNPLENIFIFYLPLINSVAKTLLLGRKNIRGGFAHLGPPIKGSNLMPSKRKLGTLAFNPAHFTDI